MVPGDKTAKSSSGYVFDLIFSNFAAITSFKLYALDVGLLGAMAGHDDTSVIAGNSAFTEFKGAYPEVGALRFSLSGYREQDWMRNVPLYAISNRQLWG